MRIFGGVFFVVGIYGKVWSLFRLMDLIYANMGSKYRPTKELDKFLENLIKRIRDEGKIQL